jgi:hypothetical protein
VRLYKFQVGIDVVCVLNVFWSIWYPGVLPTCIGLGELLPVPPPLFSFVFAGATSSLYGEVTHVPFRSGTPYCGEGVQVPPFETHVVFVAYEALEQ